MRSSLLSALSWLAQFSAAQFHVDLINRISVVKTTYGTVFTNNITDTKISVFKGIPYGRPPIGDLRWRSPLPPNPWLHPINTTTSATACWGFIGANTTATTSEDCLFLNVWTPAQSDTNRLPVMVWVHGGGFNFDSGLNPLFDGVQLCRKGVIVVAINYRLGNFGFLAHPALDAEDPVGNSGNFGIQDVMLALHWVRRNIDAFGGDSHNVMLFGESAGAHALGSLMASPLNTNLFDKVMCSSGSFWDSEHGSMENFDQSRQRGIDWATSVAGPHTSIAELRALPAYVVQNTSMWSGLDPSVTSFSANVDNYVIPQVPAAVFATGKQAKIPFLSGFNAREDTAFQQRGFDHSSAAAFNERVFTWLSMSGNPEAMIRAGLDKYFPATSDSQANESSNLLIGDIVIREQTWEAADLHEKTTGQPTWLYIFNFTSEFSPMPGHGQDMPFDFGNLKPFGFTSANVQPGPDDKKMAEYMTTYFTNFAKTSNPNKPDNLGGSLPIWPAYKSSGGHSTVAEESCGPKKKCIFELASPPLTQTFDYGRFQFIQEFRSNGAFPADWHNFTVTYTG